jgi:hypothetical protein
MHSDALFSSRHSKIFFCTQLLLVLSTAACGSAPAPTGNEEEGTSTAELSKLCERNVVIDGATVRATSPTLVQRRTGVLDLFYDAADGSVRHRAFDRTSAGWGAEESLGGYAVGKPSAAAWNFFTSGEDRLDAFVAGGDHGVYHRWWSATTGVWANWEALGGYAASGVATASWGFGRLDMIYAGANGQVQHRYWDAGWSPSEVSVGGAIIGDPAAVSWGSQRIDVFARNKADNQLWHAFYSQGAWRGSELLGGNLASSPTVASIAPGRLDVFWRDASNALRRTAFVNNAWIPDADMGGSPISGDPTAASTEAGRVDVVAEDAVTHNLVHRTLFDIAGKLVPQGCADAPLPSGDSCDFGLVDWTEAAPGATKTCSGGVRYSKYNLACRVSIPPEGTPGATGQSPQYCKRSTVDDRTKPHKCDWWDVHPVTGLAISRPYINRSEDLCAWNGKRDVCSTIVYHDPDPANPCSKVVNATVFNTYKDDPHGQFTSARNITDDTVQRGNDRQRFPVCRYDLDNAPFQHINEANAAKCGGYDQIPVWPNCSDPGYRADGSITTCSGCTATFDDDSCGSQTQYLPFGSSLSDIPGGTSHLDVAHSGCLTDENNSIDAEKPAVSVGAKYARLAQNLGDAKAGKLPGFDNTSLVRQLVLEMKLLFEMYGDSLPLTAQQESARLYFDYPDVDSTPACGTIVTPPSIPQCGVAAATIANLNTTMAFCARMTAAHVSPRVRDIDAVKYACLDLGATIGTLRAPLIAGGGSDDGSAAIDSHDTCGFKAYRALYDTFVTTPLGARMNDPRDPRVAADQPELQMRIYLMDRWYRAIEAMYPYVKAEASSASVRKEAWKHAEDLEGSLWRGVYRNLFPQASVGTAPATSLDATALVALTHDSLQADHDLLKLALTPFTRAPDGKATMPLQTAPLLILLADGLEGMSQRLQEVGIYHDMGCAYVDCTKGVESEITHMVELLASVADPNALFAALNTAHNVTDASGQKVVRADWLDVYDALSLNHLTLEGALKDAQYGDSTWTYAPNQAFLQDGGLVDLPDPSRHLASVLQSMRARNNTYRATGLFNPSARNRLPGGIQQDEVESLRTDVATLAGQLQQMVTDYGTNLTGLSMQVIQEMGLKGQSKKSSNEIVQRLVHIHALSSDMVGLGNSLELNERELGTFARSYSSATAIDTNAVVRGGALPGGQFPLTAKDARASGPLTSAVSGVASKTFSNIAKGTIVTVHVGGGDRWSPTCALQKTTLSGPTTPGPFPVSEFAVTGPEGYVINFSKDHFTANKNETANTLSAEHHDALDYKVCSGSEIKAGLELFGSGAKTYTDMSLCASAGDTFRASHSQGTSSSDGEEMKSSANFVTGLRLPSTPFPNAPVGALLAVVTPTSSPDVPSEIRVVQAPDTTILLDADSSVHLVVNDIAAAGCVTDTTHALNVTVSTAVHVGAALSWVNAGLGNVMHTIRQMGGEDGVATDASGSLIAQGRMLPEQEASIRSQAQLDLVKECKTTQSDPTLCDPAVLPESVRNFITASIDRELTRIALKLQIISLRREVQAQMLGVQELVDDYNASGAQGRIAELLPKWTLRNLDTDLMRAETAALVNKVTYGLYPVLQLRYAKILPTLRVDSVLGPALMTLVNAKWDAPVKDLAQAAVKAATNLVSATQSIKETIPPLAPKYVALSFPAPGKVSTTWVHADATRSGEVWAEAKGPGHVATLRILPEDLYRKDGGPSNLHCTEEVPVIRDFAVVLAGQSIDTTAEGNFNSRWVGLPTTVSSTLTFATAATFDKNKNLFSVGGPLQFEVDSDWTSMDTHVIASADAIGAVDKYLLKRDP